MNPVPDPARFHWQPDATISLSPAYTLLDLSGTTKTK